MRLIDLTFYCIVSMGFSLAQGGLNNKSFPANFLFGTGTGSFQVEGAWDEDGKGESIWDYLTHTKPGLIKGNATGEVASDSYHKYKEDVVLLKDLGVDFYRFSLSWPRILPNGTTNYVNEVGVNYYKNVIKELKENNIEPFVTLYQWDLPEISQKQGGWIDKLVTDSFSDYARFCFETFGDDVKYWLTFHEPRQACLGGYGFGTIAPLVEKTGVLDYKCAHNILKAHANTWHIYDKEFRASQNGKISIALDSNWFEPENDTSADKTAVETRFQFGIGWFAHPIFIGDYPDIMITRIEKRSKKEGRRVSRLPTFTEEEKSYILGTHDFLALNTYTSSVIRAEKEQEVAVPLYESDLGVIEYQPSDWTSSASPDLKITPWGMRKLLNWVKDTYGDQDIFITANGVADDGSTLDDDVRISYFRDYLSSVRDAIDDGVNVMGYTAWSFLDGFEWLAGYTEKYGLYSVDFTVANRTRTPKSSVEYFKQIVSTHCLVDKCQET